MSYSFLKRSKISANRLTLLALSSVVTLSACGGGSDGTVTTLEQSRISLEGAPDFLFEGEYENVFNEGSLQPVVELSNGESVTMAQVDGKWTGDIFVAPASNYTVSVTWLERSGGSDPDLNIARRTFEVEVADDGTATEISRSEFTTVGTGLDFDGDGVSNADERAAGSSPFDSDDVPGIDPGIDPGTDNEPDNEPGNGTDNEPDNGADDCPAINATSGIQGEWSTFHPDVAVRALSIGDGILDVEMADLSIRVVMPALLFNDQFEGVFDRNNLRPVITFENGGSVLATVDCEMRSDDFDIWEGTFTIAAGQVYNATITWVEIYNSNDSIDVDDSFDGEELPLVIRTFDLDVGKDGRGTIRLVGPNEIEIEDRTDLDADDDGIPNATERSRRSSPFLKPGQFQSATSIFVAPPTADIIVPRISSISTPSIDGKNVTLDSDGQFTGEWTSAVQTDISGAILTIDNRQIDKDAQSLETAPLGRWAAMHDGDEFYIALIIEAVDEDDVLELFLNANDITSVLLPLHEAMDDAKNGNPEPRDLAFASAQNHSNSDQRRNSSEYNVYELRLNLRSADISSDDVFGFGLQINDNDSDNEAKWGWRPPGEIHIDMGTLKLE